MTTAILLGARSSAWGVIRRFCDLGADRAGVDSGDTISNSDTTTGGVTGTDGEAIVENGTLRRDLYCVKPQYHVHTPLTFMELPRHMKVIVRGMT